MIIDCALYRDGMRQHRGTMSLQDAAAGREGGGFVWLGLFEPSLTELDQVRSAFGLHELAVEDAQKFHLRPKVEAYEGDVRLVILRTARYDDQREEVDFGEISVFRRGRLRDHRPAGRRQRIARRPGPTGATTRTTQERQRRSALGDPGPGHRRLRACCRRTGTRHRTGRGDRLRRRRRPTERIYFLRREVTNFYRAVHPLLAVVGGVERGVTAKKLLPYFRDVHDHLSLVNEEVAAQRDLLATVLEANMAVISVEQTEVGVRQNATIERLTILATIFLPLDVRHRVLRPELRLAGRRASTGSPRS